MYILSSLIFFPLLAALLVLFCKTQKQFAGVVRVSSAIIIALSVLFTLNSYNEIITVSLADYGWIKYLVAALEVALAAYIIYIGVKTKRYLVAAFALIQGIIILTFEFTAGHHIATQSSLIIDKLSLLMVLIIGIIGSLICIYAVEYMKDYHHHHPEIADRRGMFFCVLFVFMFAMFGLVMSNDLTLMLFCWEITSFSSYMLIGYSKTAEAENNSFLALTINVFGGLLFTIGLVIFGVYYGIADLEGMLRLNPNEGLVMLAVLMLAVAGLTKSAQMPFSKWLLGAMVAPTPTSAMLHSSTMVKAGVYLIIRLAPMLGANPVGVVVTLVGSITFLTTAIMAVSKTDAKKILAYSTISNLGLIVACAGIGTGESIWAAIMLIVFHAIAKSLLFLTVGSSEHQLGSRDVEAMDGLYKISTTLSILLIVGIAGMFIAPFGMLISKWAAMKAFIDYGNMLVVLIAAFGSTITFFFWTKWLGHLIENTTIAKSEEYTMRIDEKFSLYILAAMVIIVCLLHPLLSRGIVIPYIDASMNINFISPIDSAGSSIIILMMFILFILSIVLVPIYSRSKIQPGSLYLAGENTGDNKSFNGSMGEVRQVELRNWYLEDIFGEKIWFVKSQVLCFLVLGYGLLAIFGGLI